MELVFQGLAGIAIAIHLYIFYLESLSWGSRATNRVFGVSEADAATLKVFALNQGFYNLFLALAGAGGLVAMHVADATVGFTLYAYACASMLGAALVLVISQPRLLRAALIQGLPPGASLLAWALS